MTKQQPKRHHWWPVCVSKHWADADGGVHRLSPHGEIQRARPESFGVIGNGHFIKLGESDEPSPWDHNFEGEFQSADDAFPHVIKWLDSLDRAGPPFEIPLRDRIMPQPAPDKRLHELVECIVSLAVRGPMYRERAVALAEDLRGPLPERKRNGLIGANMQRSQREAVKALCGRGKLMIIYSPEREFIFGDGFFHNLYAPVQHLSNAKILAPITPWMSVLFAYPTSYRVEPRLVTMTATMQETDRLNQAVQVYSGDQIFYRSEKPIITDAYKRGTHLLFADDRNPVDDLIYSMPGIKPRDTSLDFLRDRFGLHSRR